MAQRVSSPEFVGRAGELAVLTQTFTRVTGGEMATLLIGGDAGVGKSRLVAELVDEARRRDGLVATGMCVPVEGGGLPFAPVVGILRHLSRQLGPAVTDAVLGPLAHGLRLEVTDDPGRASSATPPVAELAKTQLFESVLSCLADLAERSVLVLVFEDLQWADTATTELLTFLTRNLTDARLLVLGTYRVDELAGDARLKAWSSELQRHPQVGQLRLDGLNRDEMTEMIGAIVGRRPDWTLVDAVWTRSQGNPFFAEELTAARHSESLSPEFRGVVMSRVERLSGDAQQVLRIVAAAGATADHQLLEAVGVLAPGALDRALAEAIDQHVLVVDAARLGYRFRHALLREVVEASLLPGERVRLHRDLAVALAADSSLGAHDPANRVAQLAHHWWMAGEWREALAASLPAADAAVAVWAFPEALTHLEHALAALGQLSVDGAPTIDRLELLARAGEVAYLGGASERSVELARAAIDDAESVGDRASLARHHAVLGRNLWSTGDSGAAFEAYRRAASLVPADVPSVELARVLAEEARGLMLMSRFVDAEARCREGLAAARAVGARFEESHLLCTLGCCRGSLGQIAEGIDLVRSALVVAEEVGDVDALNRAFTALSSLLVDAGRLEEGAAVVFDAAAVGEELWGVRLNGAASNSVEALIRAGRHGDASALLAQTGDRGVGSCIAGPALQRSMMATREGRFAEAHESLELADELTAWLSDLQSRGVFHMQVAELALEEGRASEAFEAVERALALAASADDEVYTTEMCLLAARALADEQEQARTTGRRLDADKARLLATGFAQEAARLAEAPVQRGGSATPRTRAFAATAAAERSRLDVSDPELWSDAGRRWLDAGEPYPRAYCRWREAEARLARRDGRARAEACLQEAWQVSTELGAAPLQGSIEQLAQRGRIVLRDLGDEEVTAGSSLGSDLGLTPREVEVLGLLAEGRTDREIAEQLFISRKTASVHVSNLLRKLEVGSRIQAGRIGQAHGLGA